jgi:hypothetical protein
MLQLFVEILKNSINIFSCNEYANHCGDRMLIIEHPSGYTLTTVNCHNMKMTEQNHNFTPKIIIFQKTMCTKKCVSAR